MRTTMKKKTTMSKSARRCGAILPLVLMGIVLAASSALVAPAGAAESGKVVNINTATGEQLALLPRVGASVAQRIIDFRDKNGRFKTLEDLMLVRGIGEKTYELIEPHVTLTGDTTLADKVRVSETESDRDSS